MGTGETVISKPSKPTSSSQAYYAAGAPPSPFFPSPMAPPSPHPYMWGCQYPMMSPYGTPIPYPPAMYPPGGFYFHPPITMAHSPAPKNPEATEDQVPAKKSKEVAAKGKDRNGGKAVSVSGSDDVSPSDESRTEEDSSYGTDENANQQENAASRKGSFRQMLADAAGSRNKTTSAVQASSDGKPVHMRMDLRSSSTGVPANVGSNASGAIVPAPMPEQRIQDERELKRQKRKQSNRESAKRSRLRKLAEFEELEQRVGSLTDENGSLREELQRLAEECEKLTTENNTINDVLTQLGGQEAVANLEQPTSPDLPSNDEGNS